MALSDSIKGELAKGAQAAVSPLVDIPKAGVEMLLGENPIPKIKESIRRSVWGVFAMPFRIAGHVGVSAAKGTAKTAWNIAASLPIVPGPK